MLNLLTLNIPDRETSQGDPSEKIDASALRKDTAFLDAEVAILELLRPIRDAKLDDEVMISLAFSETVFVEPLNKHEVIVLACILYREISRQKNNDADTPFNYVDALMITDKIAGKPMNTTMVYKTLDSLKSRGLIDVFGREQDSRTGRASQGYKINSDGRTALRLAVMNAHHLRTNRGEKAA